MAKLAVNKEFERKFWVLKDRLPKLELGMAARVLEIEQGYLAVTPAQVRFRITDGAKAVLEVKGPNDAEFGPYEVPYGDARQMLDTLRVGEIVRKTRHEIPARFDGLRLTWEVDVFKGANHPLVVAEIETPEKDTPLDRARFPAWIGDEITGDPVFDGPMKNKNLVLKPFSAWTKKLQALAEKKMRSRR